MTTTRLDADMYRSDAAEFEELKVAIAGVEAELGTLPPVRRSVELTQELNGYRARYEKLRRQLEDHRRAQLARERPPRLDPADVRNMVELSRQLDLISSERADITEQLERCDSPAQIGALEAALVGLRREEQALNARRGAVAQATRAESDRREAERQARFDAAMYPFVLRAQGVFDEMLGAYDRLIAIRAEAVAAGAPEKVGPPVPQVHREWIWALEHLDQFAAEVRRGPWATMLVTAARAWEEANAEPAPRPRRRLRRR